MSFATLAVGGSNPSTPFMDAAMFLSCIFSVVDVSISAFLASLTFCLLLPLYSLEERGSSLFNLAFVFDSIVFSLFRLYRFLCISRYSLWGLR